MVGVGVKDPTIGLYSSTYATRSGMLNQVILDGANDVIFGRSPVSAWDQVIANWRSQGGEQMRQEFQQALATAG